MRLKQWQECNTHAKRNPFERIGSSLRQYIHECISYTIQRANNMVGIEVLNNTIFIMEKELWWVWWLDNISSSFFFQIVVAVFLQCVRIGVFFPIIDRYQNLQEILIGMYFLWLLRVVFLTSQCRDNERGGVLNHQRLHCLLNHLFGRRSKKTSKLRVTGLCAGNSP